MKIVVNGGLGNQLFQYAYAHRFADSLGSIKIFRDAAPRDDRPFELDLLLNFCDHSSIEGTSGDEFMRYRFGIIKLLSRNDLNFLIPKAQSLLRTNLELTPFSFTHSLKSDLKRRISAGYFQHWEYVESVWPVIGLEIINAFEKIDLKPEIVELVANSIILHVRQGDLNNAKSTMGILSGKYYERIISDIRNQKILEDLIVVTDDVAGAIRVTKELQPRLILGPKDLTAWQTLKLMSQSKNLVIANSTLSWWGGFISFKSGGSVYMPDPWFLNWHEPVGSAFYFPGCHKRPATFLEKTDNQTKL
jgi:hypothetical protein